MSNPIDTIMRSTIGYSDLLSQLSKVSGAPTFPPYDIIEKEDGVFLVNFAVAGFSKYEVSVTRNGSDLSIIGGKNPVKDVKYIHNGIAARSFSRTFKLSDNVDVDSVRMSDGILSIRLVTVSKEDKNIEYTIE